MPCETEIWKHAKNSTTECARPPIVHCVECRGGICSAHIIECEVCNLFYINTAPSSTIKNMSGLPGQMGNAA